MIVYHVSDHAIVKFQQRIALLPIDAIKKLINSQIAKRPPIYFVNWDKGINPVYIGIHEEIEFYIVLKQDLTNNRHYVATILDIDAELKVRYFVKKRK